MSNPDLPPLDDLELELWNAVDEDIRQYLAADVSPAGVITIGAFVLMRALNLDPKPTRDFVKTIARNLAREAER